MKNLIDMGYSGLRRVISGGQVGVDRGALDAGCCYPVETGGVAPLGYRTTVGADEGLRALGLTEHKSADYPPRTLSNVLAGDGTLVIASDVESAGTVLTMKYCITHKKPYFLIEISKSKYWDGNSLIKEAAVWVVENEIETLNVAGNHLKPEYHHTMAFEIVTRILMELDDVGMVKKLS